jgi:hypothetical protein
VTIDDATLAAIQAELFTRPDGSPMGLLEVEQVFLGMVGRRMGEHVLCARRDPATGLHTFHFERVQ